MTKIEYKDFTVQTALTLPVTVDNFFTCNISISTTTKCFAGYIYKEELSLPNAIAILSGNESDAKRAISNILFNRSNTINNIKNWCNIHN